MAFARNDREQFVVTLSPEASVLEAATSMAERHVGTVVIVSPDRKPIGIITDRDLVVRVLAARLDPAATPVSQVMSKDLVTARDDSTDVATLMGLRGVRRVPLVSEAGAVTGLVSFDDLLAVHAHRLSCLAQAVAREQAHESSASRRPK